MTQRLFWFRVGTGPGSKFQFGTSRLYLYVSQMNCLFCKIVEGKIPSTKVFEDSDVLGFKDITPQAPVHYLFISKKHYQGLADVPLVEAAILSKIHVAIKQVADEEGLSKKGFRVVINTNQEGGQSVYHLHFHLLAGKQMSPLMTGV